MKKLVFIQIMAAMVVAMGLQAQQQPMQGQPNIEMRVELLPENNQDNAQNYSAGQAQAFQYPGQQSPQIKPILPLKMLNILQDLNNNNRAMLKKRKITTLSKAQEEISKQIERSPFRSLNLMLF